MRRTIITGAVSIPVYIAYLCSKCGSINAEVKTISETSQVTTYGKVRKSINEDMKDTAIENAKTIMRRRLEDMFGESKLKMLRAAEFNCKCSECGNKEAWSKLRFSKIEITLWMVTITALLFAIIGLLLGDFITSGVIVAIPGGILCLWYIYKTLRIKAIEKQISMLPADSIPILALSQSALTEKIRGIPSFYNKIIALRKKSELHGDR